MIKIIAGLIDVGRSQMLDLIKYSSFKISLIRLAYFYHIDRNCALTFRQHLRHSVYRKFRASRTLKLFVLWLGGAGEEKKPEQKNPVNLFFVFFPDISISQWQNTNVAATVWPDVAINPLGCWSTARFNYPDTACT